jgi:phosphodiesterase/alkaline phosphatase D-like protein
MQNRLVFSSLLICMTVMLLFSTTKAANNNNDTLLLVVGDVQANSVRILYENLKHHDEELQVSLSTKNEPQSVLKSLHVVSTKQPNIVRFDELEENTDYIVQFEAKTTLVKSTVTFTTFSSSTGTQKKLKLVVVSCDRYFEDEDDSMWKKVIENESDRHGMVHLGDQVYADQVAKDIIQLAKDDKLPAFEELVEKFRQVYRKTWGHPTMQKVLRHGAHWMLPDDHDIINNLDKEMIEKTNPNAVPIMIEAGKTAYYEYQYQLYNDLFINGTAQKTSAVEKDQIYFFRNMANVCWMFLDTRLQRTFQFDSQSQFIGTNQFLAIREALKTCGEQAKTTIAFSSVPLLFVSESFAKLIYSAEKEKYSTHPDLQEDTIKLLNTLGDFKIKNPRKEVKLIAGDLHQFFVSRICNVSAIPVCIDQLVTSGITKGSRVIDSIKLYIFYIIHRYFQKPVVGTWELQREQNQNGKPLQESLAHNYAVIEVNPEPSAKQFFNWRGVTVEGQSFEEKLLIQVYDNFPTVRIVLVLGFVGIIALLASLCFVPKKNAVTVERKKQ